MKEIANSKTHDLKEPDEMVVKVQQIFPNCGKYRKCCIKDKKFWKEMSDVDTQVVKATRRGFKTVKLDIKPTEPPEGFEGW